MNTPPRREPADAELDRLLASRLRRTSPEFELRWRELRGQLGGRAPGNVTGRRWLPWLGLATGLATVALVVALLQPGPTLRPADASVFEELIALDAALAPARPLLDAENREALLHLPANSL